MENFLDKIEILFEDNNVLAINKPAGLIVHSAGRGQEPSVADWITKNFPLLKDVGEPWLSPQGETIPRPGIVHRLDRQTSGVLIIAKNRESHDFLKKQFQNREVEKIYRAFVYGHLKEKGGVIEMAIGRTKKIPRKWSAWFDSAHHKFPGKSGTLRAAVTHWKILDKYLDSETGERVSYLEIMPKTGRTHQIRVHFQTIGHPVVCDKIYATQKPCLLGFKRLALHAFGIQFKTPDNKIIGVEAPLPADFQKAFEIGRPATSA